MPFKIESRHLKDVVVIVPEVFGDDRGYFMEAFQAEEFKKMGLPAEFPQDNCSRSRKGVVRGLHFQWEPPMGKLMRITSGAAFLVAVDIRKGSPTLGKGFGIEVTAENKKQVWAPAGFARGFCALTDDCEVLYKCTGTYNAKCEAGIYAGDPELGIQWPIDITTAIMSDKDRKAPRLAQWLASPLSDHFIYNTEAALK